MTAQICDTFIFKGEGYSLIGIQGGNLSSPAQFGMVPMMNSTACYRGFYATYELTENGLYLRHMTLCEKDGNYLPISSVLPEVKAPWEASYHNLSVYIPFTGKMLSMLYSMRNR